VSVWDKAGEGNKIRLDHKEDYDFELSLDVGCGLAKHGMCKYGMDLRASSKPDIVGDMHCMPFPDGFLDFIYCSNTLEHTTEVAAVMEEFYRVLKDKGNLIVIVPHAFGKYGFYDPDHKHFFLPEQFRYFLNDGRLSAGYEPGYKTRFTPLQLDVQGEMIVVSLIAFKKTNEE